MTKALIEKVAEAIHKARPGTNRAMAEAVLSVPEIAEALAQADADGRWMIRRVEGEDMGESVWVTNGELLDQANARLRAVEAERDEAVALLRRNLPAAPFREGVVEPMARVEARRFLASMREKAETDAG